MSSMNKKNSLSENKQEVVSITYEEIGLFPRSFSRVLDRFLKQVFSDVENLVIQEYRFYRYLFLTTLKCLFILFFVPFFVNFVARTYVVRPLTEYFWNTKQPEIFLNAYQQKHAFAELKDFEEKLYFESLIYPKSAFQRTDYSNSEESALNKANLKNHFQNDVSVNDASLLEVQKTTQNSVIASGVLPDLPLPRSGQPYRSAVATGQAEATDTDKRDIMNHSGRSLVTAEKGNMPISLIPPAGLSVYASTESSPLTDRPFDGGEGRGVVQRGQEETKVPSYSEEKTESLINSYTLKSSLFVYQTIELAQRYNDQSIEAITNLFADLISLFTLFYLLYALEIQINITKSFLLEVFFGLDDSKKSLLILLITDLLVGYHSSNLWELFFEFLFHHYGLPESQTGIFLLVATLPVLLDVLFKYLIFRHLNRSSPATVATYHAMIE
jgi:hypothetical protein